MTEDTTIINSSICKRCHQRIKRTIIPPDYYWEEIGEEIDDDDEKKNQIIEHNYCMTLEIPLDHIVLDCNKFIPSEEVTLVKNSEVFAG